MHRLPAMICGRILRFVDAVKAVRSDSSEGFIVRPPTFNSPTFFCASFFPFFFFACPAHPSPGNFFPKILSFWDLRSTLSSREKASSRGWVLGTVLEGVRPTGKKGKSFFFLARKKGEILGPSRRVNIKQDLYSEAAGFPH